MITADGTELTLDTFFGANDDFYGDDLSPTEIIFGADLFGNQWVLDAKSGAVRFLDHGESVDAASSFTDFLKRIEQIPWDDE